MANKQTKEVCPTGPVTILYQSTFYWKFKNLADGSQNISRTAIPSFLFSKTVDNFN